MNRKLATVIRLAAAAALLLTLAAAPDTTSAKYITNTLYNYESTIEWGDFLATQYDENDGHWIQDLQYLYDWVPQMNKLKNWRGFDIIYTTPIVVTPGVLAQGSGGTSPGAQVTLENCPAGWYAFKIRGGDGGCGQHRTYGSTYRGQGGTGGSGATVSGYTYISGGTITLYAGRAGMHANQGASGIADYGGGRTSSNSSGGDVTWAGAGGGYSGIFLDLPTSPTDAQRQAAAVAIAGGGGGGGGGGSAGTGYNCGGKGGDGGSYNTANNGTSAEGGAGGAGGTRSGNSSGTHYTNGPGANNNNKGTAGSGGGGGGGGGNRDCSRNDPAHIPSGGSGGVIDGNAASASYYGKGGGGAGGTGPYAGDVAGSTDGGNGAGQNPGSANLNGSTVANAGNVGSGSGMSGGTGGYVVNTNADHRGYGGGGGGGGYSGGGGGSGRARGGGGGGGGSSYLWPWVYPLSDITTTWGSVIPADPATSANSYTRSHWDNAESGTAQSTSTVQAYNGYVWIMYLGARSPDEPDEYIYPTPANGVYRGNNHSSRYHFSTGGWAY